MIRNAVAPILSRTVRRSILLNGCLMFVM